VAYREVARVERSSTLGLHRVTLALESGRRVLVGRGMDADRAHLLAALLEAYETENAQIERQRERTRRALGQRGNGGLLDENIDAFEQAQQRSSAHRELGVKLSMRQTATEEIAAELERREREADVLQVHLKRLLTI